MASPGQVHVRWIPNAPGFVTALCGHVVENAQTIPVDSGITSMIDRQCCGACQRMMFELRRYVRARSNGMKEPLGIHQFADGDDDLPF